MARPVSVMQPVVLEAARKVFLQHGYQATTAQVARAAGISEGSLFKHFRSKHELFMTAMQVGTVQMAWHDRLVRSVGSGDIREQLEFAGRQLLERLRIIIPRMMMMQSSGIPLPQGRRGRRDVPPPLAHVRVLTTYFRGEMKLGRLAMRHPESQAHAFFGALSHYVFCETLYGHRPAPAPAYVRTLVDTVLKASALAGPRKSPRRNAKRSKDL